MVSKALLFGLLLVLLLLSSCGPAGDSGKTSKLPYHPPPDFPAPARSYPEPIFRY